MTPPRRSRSASAGGTLPKFDDPAFDWRDFVPDDDLEDFDRHGGLPKQLRRAAEMTCFYTSVDSSTIPHDDVDAIDRWLQSTDAERGGNRRAWYWQLVLNRFPYPRGEPVLDPNESFRPAW